MSSLADPLQIRRIPIKNRIYMTAMHLNMCMDYEVSDPICAFYQRRAKGGAGAIAVGFVTVHPLGSMFSNIGAHDDRFIPGLRRLAASIAQYDCKPIAQINHQGRYAFSMFLDGESPVAPSAIPSKLTGETPRELTPGEIEELVSLYAQTARRCQEASFSMVEILCGTGYLISQFLSPLTNQRQDEWGGNEESRMRFGVEVVREVRRVTGEDYPIVIRMNGNDMMEGGMRGDSLRRFARALQAAGADAFCINVGWHEARVPQITMGVPPANFAYLSRLMREELERPVIASHRINDPKDAQRLLREGFCDMVGLGRALIADPDWPLKALGLKEGPITHCIACAQGCLDHVFTLQPVECLCNPEAGHELDGEISLADTPKRIAVVGGGVAGMAAAEASARRGHQVTLFEKEDGLGGQIRIASKPKGREEFLRLAEDLESKVHASGVQVVLGKEIQKEDLVRSGADAVILATGARPIEPDLDGTDLPHVVQAWDVLMGRSAVGDRVVVVGGGAVGVETAATLAQLGTLSPETVKFLLVHRAEDPEEIRRLCLQGTKRVTLVEMTERFGKDIGKSTRWTLLQELRQTGVHLLKESKVLEIQPEGVLVEQPGGKTERLPADTVVLALGAASYCPLQQELKDTDLEVLVVGDAQKVALAMDAVHEGYRAGRSI